MALYSANDTVICKIGYGKVCLATESDFELVKEFTIICTCETGYLILLPRDLYLTNSFLLNEQDRKQFGLHKKFLGDPIHYVSDDHIVSLRIRMTGLACLKCAEYFEYAEVDQIDENGHGAFVCWRCKNYPFYL